MASLGIITLKGKSGNSYAFEKYILNTNFSAVGGLYLFSREADNTNYLIYVGHTQDLSSRFTDHHKQDCINKNGGTHISVCAMSLETARLAAEKDILANYNFPCNEVNN